MRVVMETLMVGLLWFLLVLVSSSSSSNFPGVYLSAEALLMGISYEMIMKFQTLTDLTAILIESAIDLPLHWYKSVRV